MNYFVAVLALVTTPAFAHPGHTETVAGHSHTLTDLMLMGAAPALIVGALMVGVFIWLKRRNG